MQVQKLGLEIKSKAGGGAAWYKAACLAVSVVNTKKTLPVSILLPKPTETIAMSLPMGNNIFVQSLN